MQSAVRLWHGARVSRKPAIIVHLCMTKVPWEGKNARGRGARLSHDLGEEVDLTRLLLKGGAIIGCGFGWITNLKLD